MKKLLIIILLIFPSVSFSKPKVTCPQIIADKKTNTYFSKNRFRCFNKPKDAQKAGFSSIEATPLSCTALSTSLLNLSGSGDKNTEPFILSKKPTLLKYTHNGESNFIVQLRDSSGEYKDLITSTIGFVDSETFLYQEGEYYLKIVADGDWSFKIIQ